MYIAWDTETTGLPLIRTSPTLKNIQKYDTCRIVSLAAVKFSSRGREVASFHRIIKPDGYRVGATEVHGISHEYAMEHGSPFKEVFKDFLDFVGPIETLVAHNSRFDENVLISETLRIGMTIPSFDYVCTNNMHKEKMFSPIKLIHLYTNTFGEGFDGAHDALNDARACGKVYPHLKERTYRHKPVGISRITIKASDVSGIMGMSQFKKPQDVVEELWLKHSPETFTMKTKEERALDALATCPDVRCIGDVEASSLTPAEKGLVKDYYRKSSTTKPPSSSPGTFYKYNVCCIDGTLYQIVGKVDTIRQNEDGSRTLIEMKRRTNGLFNRLRDYEEVQCRVYLSMMHPSVRNVLLVESYDGQMKSYLVERDEAKWEKIRRRLQNFCSYFHECISHKE